MIKSMTGFGSREAKIAPFGKISVELRSTNHKFLETVLHVPEGFLSLEDKIKKVIEAQVKRGRVTCAVSINGAKNGRVFVNENLLRGYLAALKKMKHAYRIRNDVGLEVLIHLPGVLSVEEDTFSKARIWPRLKTLVTQSLEDLMAMRRKEGAALSAHLKSWAQSLKKDIVLIKARCKRVVELKLAQLASEEEKNSFLKNADITEEIERLWFHGSNFIEKLKRSGPIGKELDFIAQEMQREANTMGAKSCDAGVSATVVEIKSKIEKIREQVQNIE